MKEGDQFVGHNIDVIKEMVAVYGWKVEFVHTSWKAMADDLKANRFDVAVGGITRSAARVTYADFLPAYAPFGKVALVHQKSKNRFKTLNDLNQPDVRVIKNPAARTKRLCSSTSQKPK